MGFPIRANIFRANSAPQRYFRRFPIQVAVLFSPKDDDFAPVFRDIFLHLDQLTGDRVAFFAVLDPPADWSQAARNRTWWREQRESVGELGFSFDERPLVNEIARRFGVEWWEMPVIVVSPNLWAAEYIVAPTSASSIEQQLEALTNLVRRWGRPGINQIIDLFENYLNADVRYVPANFSNREAFYDFYDVLSTYDPEYEGIRNRKAFNRHVRQIARQIKGPYTSMAFSRSRDQETEHQDDNVLFDQAATETAGRIVPVATVAERAFTRLSEERHANVAESLDEASIAMVETSLTVGRFLEEMSSDNMSGQQPMRFGDRKRDSRNLKDIKRDFSPGAMGIWKMLELETNMSLIQAGRQALGIVMPDYFTLHDPSFPIMDAVLETGTRNNGDPICVNLNLLDRRHRPRHVFLTLGNGWHAVDSLRNLYGKRFDSIIMSILGNPLPNIVMESWKALRPIRNKASHVAPLSWSDYQKVLKMGLNAKFLGPLMQIKCALM